MSDHALERGIELSLDCDELLPEHFEMNPLRLHQVLLNLVGNAVESTEEGSMMVWSRLAGGEAVSKLTDVDPGGEGEGEGGGGPVAGCAECGTATIIGPH